MTDIEIMDRSVFAYLSTITEHLVYSTTDKAFQNMTKNMKYKDYIPYSMISFFRTPSFDIDMSRFNHSAATYGDFVRLREVNGNREARYVQNLPVNLTYQIDIWAATATRVLETATKLISKIYLQNQVLISPMNPDGEEARFHIINVEWMDNSDLEVENEKGRLYRHTVLITIDSRIKLTSDVITTKFDCSDVDIYNDKEEINNDNL